MTMPDVSGCCEVSPIGDLLVRGAQLHPERDALVFPDQRRTYQELLDGAIGVARGLLALGLKRGDHVGLMTTNSPEFVEGFFGSSMLGCITVPLNARHKTTELAYIIENAKLVALLTTADADEYVDYTELFSVALPSLRSAPDPARLHIPEAPSLRHTILLRGGGRSGFMSRADFDQLAHSIDAADIHEMRQRVRLRDTATILYTSGTTANPKGCMLSQEAMTRGAVERARSRFASGSHPIAWNSGPLFHIAALAPLIGCIGATGTYVTDVHFEIGRALQLMEQEKVTMAWPWFPAIVQGLLDHPSFDPARLAHLKKIMLIGPPHLIRRVQSVFPSAEIFQACGMTETAGIFALSAPDETAEQRAATQGKPAPGVEIRIVDFETGKDARPGEVGEILVRGCCVMDRYYRDDEKTAEALDEQGWLHTGDLYRRDENGSLVFNGRLKDMLKVGGENVAAVEIEAFLCEHPAIKLAEVVGIPDHRLDEVPVAFVELRPGQNAQAEELIAFCKGKIANYKIPRAVYFRKAEEWPMSATKINKRALRQWLLTETEKSVTAE